MQQNPYGAATLTNEKKAVFDIVSNGVSLTNGGATASTFSNAGLLEMTSVGGAASIAANVTNNGTILAQGGVLAMSGTITGNGVLDLQSSGALDFSSTVASTETVKFLDSTGSMAITLPSPTAFSAEITNFSPGNSIDLTNISNATGTFANGTLTFLSNTNQQVVAELYFTGSPNFNFANDGRGGTLITDPVKGHNGPNSVFCASSLGAADEALSHVLTELVGVTLDTHGFLHDGMQDGSGVRVAVESANEQEYAFLAVPGGAMAPDMLLVLRDNHRSFP